MLSEVDIGKSELFTNLDLLKTAMTISSFVFVLPNLWGFLFSFHKLDRLRGEPQTWRSGLFRFHLVAFKVCPLQRENMLEYALKQS